MISDPIEREVTRAKVQLLLKQPFFGNMATGMKVILTNDTIHEWCKTAATDGKRLYMNRDFVASLTSDELLFVVAHEVLHAVYDHLGRRQGRNSDYYNMAADYVINYTLVKGRVGVMPPVGLYNEEYNDDFTSEQLYDLLMSQKVDIKMPLDQHLDGMGGQSGSEDGDGGDGATIKVSMSGDGPPVLTEEEMDEIRSEVLSRTIQAVQAAQQQDQPGYIPAGVKLMINELTEPKMDWRNMLDCHIRSQVKHDYTYAQLSRVDIGGGFIFPAEDDDVVAEADIVIDTSGSMTNDMLREILSEVKGIMVTFGQFKLRVCTFDTQVYGVKEFTERNIDEIDEYEMQGRGGTMFECVWTHWADEGHIPHRAVWFTDGYPCGSWGPDNYCDTLWVIHGNFKGEAPFGTTVYYEDAK